MHDYELPGYLYTYIKPVRQLRTEFKNRYRKLRALAWAKLHYLELDYIDTYWYVYCYYYFDLRF